ncbi:P-loop containing nucleoside triphosphate hydrolase protein [Crassisporium funariophilum]|nr:P-loop containing nucleoside triphosphate hydrolase protein [Crassisporium funariophilum]
MSAHFPYTQIDGSFLTDKAIHPVGAGNRDFMDSGGVKPQRPTPAGPTRGRPKKWERNTLKYGDAIFKFGRPDDIIIPVMGPTGSGKSAFINTLLGKDVAEVGHGLGSCTSQLQHFVTESVPSEFEFLKGRRLIFVDTPGFNDTRPEMTDMEILRRISAWLAYSYADGIKLGGVVYLYDMSQSRVAGTTLQQFEVFREMCGPTALTAVVLMSTKWDEISLEQGIRREEESLTGLLWKPMISAGSSVKRYQNTSQSAWEVIKVILHKVQNTHNVDSLKIQRELVDQNRRIPETRAGKLLYTRPQNTAEIRKNFTNEYHESAGNLNSLRPELYQQHLCETSMLQNSHKVSFIRRVLIFGCLASCLGL